MSSLQTGYQRPLPSVKENFNVLHEDSQLLMLLNGAFKVLTKYPTLAETFFNEFLFSTYIEAQVGVLVLMLLF